MTNSSNKPIRVILSGCDIGANILSKVMLERLQRNIEIVDSLHLSEIQVIDSVAKICAPQADWICLVHYQHLRTVDRVAGLIKQMHPTMKVAALPVMIQEKQPAKPQFLDYLHYYPMTLQHMRDAVYYLRKL